MNTFILQSFRADELLFYLRKSRTDDPLLTIAEVLERHEARLDEWAERNAEGGPVPEENRYREVGSGETIASRPRFQALLRQVESPKVKAIVVVEPSRLSRGDLEDIGYLVKVLRYTNTKVITLDRGVYDLNNDRDREDFERELMRGNDYLEYTKKILNAGKLQSVRAGNYIGQTPPYGYKRIAVKEGSRTSHTLEPIPEQAEVVKYIFELYSQGLGFTKIVQRLESEQIPPPIGKYWSTSTLSKLTQNEHYLGKVTWQYRKEVIRIENGEVLKSMPRNADYLVFEGKHPAIISQELWDAVQAVRGTHPKVNKRKNLTNPLAGIMRCSCGRMMTRRVFLNKDGTEKSATRFYCSDRRICGTASSKDVDVMAEVADALREAIDDFTARVEGGHDDAVERHRQLLERLEKKLLTLKDQEVKQWDEKLKGSMPSHIFDRLNEKIVSDIEEVQHALYEARNSMPEQVDPHERIATFRDALAAIQDPDAPGEKVNLLLKKCIERIDYHRAKYERGTEPTPIEMHFTLRV